MNIVLIRMQGYTDGVLSKLNKLFIKENFIIHPISSLKNNPLKFLVSNLFQAKKAILFSYDLNVECRLDLLILLLACLSPKGVYLIDMQGKFVPIPLHRLILVTLPLITLRALLALLQLLFIPTLLLSVQRTLRKLASKSVQTNKTKLPPNSTIAYLRTDYAFGIRTGGSVTHIAGVVKGFIKAGYNLFFLSTDRLLLIDEKKTPLIRIKPRCRIWAPSGIPQLQYNQLLIKKAQIYFNSQKPALIYQRYSAYNYAGISLAYQYGIPFVLEYNGSEIWAQKNWGKSLKFERLAERIEMANVRTADVVVVVSKPLRDELQKRGVNPHKILVNQNGVDPNTFSPSIDGTTVRQKLGVEDKVVVGFIGTFGRWHGADILAKAVVELVQNRPKSLDNVHFVFIGDGITLPRVRETIEQGKAQKWVTFVGMVPQAEGPNYLAACDIFVSPHIPNTDGTPFFGSPTKLFEYMAMGKGIVASKLDQIGEILEHQHDAWMVTPGRASNLAEGILSLVQDADLRANLGRNARQKVLDHYTWDHNVQRVVEKLKQLQLAL